MTILHYDGSFDGFLTAVFECYAQRRNDVRIRKKDEGENTLFGDTILVATDTSKAARVWNGLKTRAGAEAVRQFYHNYLSELPLSEDHMLEYVRYVMGSGQDVSRDFSHPAVLRVAQVSKMIGREKHRMEAFVRFRLLPDSLFHAVIEPDYNVLPLIADHFKNRYADQRWVIWDLRRQYGLYYDLEKVDLVQESAPEALAELENTPSEYAQLWKTYFTSTNIVERKNTKLHLQHVPHRYWKYLCEKMP